MILPVLSGVKAFVWVYKFCNKKNEKKRAKNNEENNNKLKSTRIEKIKADIYRSELSNNSSTEKKINEF